MCAVAHKKNSTITEVISEEYGLPLPTEPVPIFAQSGDNRFENVDKMILRKIECIPHGLINSPGKVGKEGEVMTDYVKWVVDRVQKIGGNDYEPVYHFDVYGILGLIFNGNVDRVADYLAGLSMLTDPNVLRIEYPMLAESKEEAIDLNSSLREKLKKKGVRVRISVDEWCNSVTDMKDFIDADAADLFQVKTPPMGGLNNSIEAVLTCKTYNLGVYLGGSCTETEHAAKVCAQIALSIRPDQVLAKPGMDVDVGHQIIYNEMQRTIKIIEHNQRS